MYNVHVCIVSLYTCIKVGPGFKGYSNVIFLLQVTDMVIVLEVVEALEGITITADDIRVSS